MLSDSRNCAVRELRSENQSSGKKRKRPSTVPPVQNVRGGICEKEIRVSDCRHLLIDANFQVPITELTCQWFG